MIEGVRDVVIPFIENVLADYLIKGQADIYCRLYFFSLNIYTCCL